jgi:nitroreductase
LTEAMCGPSGARWASPGWKMGVVKSSSELRRLVRQPSTRLFDVTKPVETAVLEDIIDVARWTGSARNRQPWRVVIVRNRAKLRELSTLGAYAHHIASAPVALVIASADNGFRDTEYDVGRFTQSLVLAAAANGLSSCPATLYPDDSVRSAAGLVNLAPGWIPRHVLSLGHRGEQTRKGTPAVPGGRKEVAELLTVID